MPATQEISTADPGGKQRRRTRAVGLLMSLPPVLVVIIFIGVPIATGFAFSLGQVGGLNQMATLLSTSVRSADGAITFDVFADIFADKQFLDSLWVTIVVTVVTVLVVTALAWGIGLYARLANTKVAHFLTGVAIIPLFIPLVIGAYAIRKFYLKTGFWGSIGQLLGLDWSPLSYHTSGMIVGQVWASLPFAVLLIASGLGAVPDALIHAARDAGASMARTVWSVMVPMTIVPTVIVATFTGVGVLGSFTVPYFTGPAAPTMLGVHLVTTYNSYQQPQQAQAMAVVMFIIAIGIGWAYVWANARSARSSAVMT